MEDRIYYVRCKDGCLFESMTKEQILTAITEATGVTPTGDEAIFTKIKEINAGNTLRFWVGTMAQYNAIAEKDPFVIYHKIDEPVDVIIPITAGGTGATTPEEARELLGITPKNINAAPDGFGLGVSAPNISDLHSVAESGWFSIVSDTANSPFRYGVGLTLKRTSNTIVKIAQGTRYAEDGILLTKTLDGSTWIDEWISPPLILGVEYRTIERFNDKPVYTKLVDCGSVPNNAEKNFAYGTPNGVVIGYSAFAYRASNNDFLTVPWGLGTDGLFITGIGAANIRIKSTYDYSMYNLYVSLKYYKTTD